MPFRDGLQALHNTKEGKCKQKNKLRFWYNVFPRVYILQYGIEEILQLAFSKCVR